MKLHRKIADKTVAGAIACLLLAAQLPAVADQARWQRLYDEGSDAYVNDRFQEAETSLRNALKERTTEDVNYARTEIILADVLEAQHRYNDAKTLYVDALNIMVKKTGESSSETIRALWHLALFYSNRLRFAEAEPLYQRIVDIRKKFDGISNAETANAIADLAKLYVRERRFAEADMLYTQVLDIRTKLFGHESAAVADSLAQISNLLGHERRYSEAETPMKEALSIYEKLYGEEDARTVDVIRSLADLYRVQGKTDQVQKYIDRVTAAEKNKGKPANARDLYVQGKYLLSKGRYVDAEPVFWNYQKLDDKPLPSTLVFKLKAAQQAAALVSLCSALNSDDLKSLMVKITGDADPKGPEFVQEAALSSFARFRLQVDLYNFSNEHPDKNIVRPMLKTIDMYDQSGFDSDSLVTSQAFLFTILRFASMNRRAFEMCRQCSQQYVDFAENLLSNKNRDKTLSLKTLILNGKVNEANQSEFAEPFWNSEPIAVKYLVHSLLAMAYLSSDCEEGGDLDGRNKSRKLNSLATQIVERFRPRLDATECCDLLLDTADSCKMEGDYAQTKLILSKVLSIKSSNRSAESELTRAKALIALVEVNLQECDYTSVVNAGQEALSLKILNEPEMLAQKASVLDNMAQAAIMLQSDQAVYYASEAIRTLSEGTRYGTEGVSSENSGAPEGKFKAQLIYAKSLIANGRPGEAITALEHWLPSGNETDEDHASLEKWLDKAEVCATLGDAQLSKHDFRAAKLNYAKALDVHRQSRTKYSIMQQVDDTFNIAICNAQLGDPAAAANLSEMAASQLLKYSLDIFPDLSFAEQRNFVQQLNYYSSLLVALRHSDKEIKSTFGYLIQWRGLLVKALRRQSLMADQAHDSQTAPIVEKWRDLKREISKLASSSSASDESLKAKIAEFSEQKENLERQLLSGTGDGGVDEAKDITADAFMKHLKTNEAYVELSSYLPLNTDSMHYYAIVVTPTSLNFIDIPNAERINMALREWRQFGMYKQSLAPGDSKISRDVKFDENQRADNSTVNSLSTLQAQLWKPILRWLPRNTDRIVLCDDGELSRLPWEMLVNEKSGGRTFLTERVDSPREFLSFANQAAQLKESKKESVLLVGAINYKNQSLQLAGTGKEIADINKLLATTSIRAPEGEKPPREIVVLTGNQPTPEKIKALLPKASIAHLATHGFFAATTKEQNAPGLHRAMRMTSTALGDAIAVRNPLVSSGILLAAGQSETRSTSDTENQTPSINKGNIINRAEEGELTAEELVELNLNKCQLIVLSACETGRGTEERGQGVLGLRSVLMAAGAKSLLLSLWSVDDEATSFLMTEFYKHLLEGKSKAESLQLAKNAVRNNREHPNWKAPCYWAAWALVGQGW